MEYDRTTSIGPHPTLDGVGPPGVVPPGGLTPSEVPAHCAFECTCLGGLGGVETRFRGRPFFESYVMNSVVRVCVR